MINTTYLNEVVTPQDTISSLNTATGGQLGIFIVFLTFIVGLLIFKNEPIENVLIYNGALMSTIAGGFILLGWIPMEYLFIGLFLLGLGIVMSFAKRN